MGRIISKLRPLPAEGNQGPARIELLREIILSYAKWIRGTEKVMFLVTSIAREMLPERATSASQYQSCGVIVHKLVHPEGEPNALNFILNRTTTPICLGTLAIACSIIGIYISMYKATAAMENRSPVVNSGDNPNSNVATNATGNRKAYEILSQKQHVAFDSEVREMTVLELAVLRDLTSPQIQEGPRNVATERSPRVEMTPITGVNHNVQETSMSQTNPDVLAGQMIDLMRGTSDVGHVENIEEVQDAINLFNARNETTFQETVDAVNAKIIEKEEGLRWKYICWNFHRQMLTSWDPWKAALWSLDPLFLIAEAISIIMSIREGRADLVRCCECGAA